MTDLQRRLAWSLLALRVTVFLVLGMWTLDKFVAPDHGAAVFATFYGLPGLGTATVYGIGALQAVVVLAFLVGFQKRIATALVFAMHLISTLTPVARYLDPWTSPNLLFYAAWPMLAAILALYLLRDYDSYFSLDHRSKARVPAEG